MLLKFLQLLVISALAVSGSFPVFASESVSLVTTSRYTSFRKTGAAGSTETLTFARRGDGSTVKARSIVGPGSMGMVTQRDILDLSSAQEVTVDQTTESINTERLTPKLVGDYQKAADCGTAGGEVLPGYGVVHETKDYDSPARFLRREAWKAPTLGCLPLKEILWVGPDAQHLRMASTREVLTITVGEPPAELFAIPSGYVELSPSQRSAEFARRFPSGKNLPADDSRER